MKPLNALRVVCVGLIALVAIVASGCSESSENGEHLTTYVESVVASPHLTVTSGKWQAFEFTVEPDMVRPRLLLDYQVTSGKDVEVFVFDEAGFAEWPRTASAVYFSERVGTVSDRIPLSRNGIHFVVVSNTFSVITDKELAMHAVLEYSLPDSALE